jgi:AefR-like transcriptional repressor, C-terminal domain
MGGGARWAFLPPICSIVAPLMQAACGEPPDLALETMPRPSWYDLPPAEALPRAGEEYLRHVLSRDQLALYRVVARDAHRFPELGRRYQEQANGARDARFSAYLDLWAEREGWIVREKRAATQAFAALLKSRLFDEALLGLHQPSNNEIVRQAQDAARNMLLLLRGGCL